MGKNCAFLDLDLFITNGIFSSKFFDKRDDFKFEIATFLFFYGDTPRSHFYGVYVSQLIHFVRVCSKVSDFNNRNHFLTAKVIDIITFVKHFLNPTTESTAKVWYQ